MRHNDANKTTPKHTNTRCNMCHSQNFDKIDSFLKPVSNILILRYLIVGRGRGLLKRRLVFCIKSVDLEEVLKFMESRIHQSKSWYYLGPFQTFKVEHSAKIIFGYKPLTFFVKSSNLDVSLGIGVGMLYFMLTKS